MVVDRWVRHHLRLADNGAAPVFARRFPCLESLADRSDYVVVVYCQVVVSVDRAREPVPVVPLVPPVLDIVVQRAGAPGFALRAAVVTLVCVASA